MFKLDKETRRGVKRTLKKIFSVKTIQKVVIGFVAIALVASYILPYIIL